MTRRAREGYGIPLAIIASGVLIAGAIFWVKGSTSLGSLSGASLHGGGVSARQEFRPPEARDHIRGNPNAEVAIVEFSDFECPFCARLHPTLSRLIEENENVAWIYRHFPLSTIHSRAFSAAVASECIARLGGNDAFWDFADSAFENQRELGENFYEEQANALGINIEAFNSCRKEESVATHVEGDYNESRALGGRGTPFGVIVARGTLTPFSGALSYDQFETLIRQALDS